TFTNITPTPATGGSLTATKTWIAFDVDITPDFDLNAANDPHIFTISVQVDDGSGLVPLPIPPNSGSVDWSFTAPDTSVTTGTCTLVAGGTCTVEQNSAVIGTGVLTATALSVDYGGTDLGPVDLTAAGSGQASALTIPVEATKVWIGYTLTLDPTDALNLWPTQPEHVVTLELTRLPDIPQLPIDDQDLAVTLTSTVATITGVSDGTVDTTTTATCTTDVTGQCQVTITSTGPGAATLSAVYTTNIGNQEASFPAVEDAEKTWRTYRVNVTPTTAENLLGTPHTFTVTVEQTDDGATWTPVENAVPSIDVSSPGIIGTETCSNGTDAAGQCTVDVSSPDTGSVTLTATYEGALNDATSEFSDDGEKTWIDYRVTVTPPTAENLVDTNHTFTVTVEVDRGSGFAPLPDATPTVTRSGVGSITSNTCPAGTDANGTCAVTIRSAAAGNTTVEAEYVGTAGDSDSATFSDSGSKTWLDYRLSVDPREATNSINDPHTFIATLEVDRGSGFGPATGETLDVNAAGVGAIITIDVSGPAAGTCTTDAAGTCRITVNSSTGGALTITVSYSAQVGDTADTMSALGTKSWIGGGIPDTGSETGPILRTAAGLMLAGLLLLLVSMRRRTAARS
ncbi:MAG: LPXTG cell wall anchor domain-containing protein, partial [Acidimicrobiia bacterium]|nr:LPXTG cell wall anchor domain-containing protein [Acidimicrobiia bacterium]